MNDWKRATLLISGLGLSNLGNWIYFVAINLTVLEMTGSAAAVAGLFVIRPIAMLLTNFWSGSLIDRVNVRELMIAVDVIRGVLILMIPFANSLWMIYSLMLLINIFGAFFGPSSSVYITKLVPAANRPKFNSMMSMTNSSAFLMGPAISGVLIVTFNAEISIICNGISFFVCAFLIYLLPNVQHHSTVIREPIGAKILINDYQTIIKFAKGSIFFITIFGLFQAASLIGFALDSQEATYIKWFLRLSDNNYGNILSLTGVGSLAGGLAATLLSKRVHYRYYMSVGASLVSLFYILFYASFDFVTAALSFVFLGFSMAFMGSGYATFIQNHVPTDMMGRFVSIADVTQGMIQIVLTLFVGVMADVISLQLACLIFSSIGFVISLLLCVKALAPSSLHFYKKEEEVE